MSGCEGDMEALERKTKKTHRSITVWMEQRKIPNGVKVIFSVGLYVLLVCS